MIYLASPYSAAPESNYAAMVDVCKRLLQHAPPPSFFCPVVHYHPIGQGLNYKQILELCIDHLHRCKQLVVVTLPGWMDSKGVLIEMAEWHPKPITLMDSQTFKGRQIAPAELATLGVIG
jgi:hypothetical protein